MKKAFMFLEFYLEAEFMGYLLGFSQQTKFNSAKFKKKCFVLANGISYLEFQD